MKKRIISLFVCVVMLFSVSFADTTSSSAFNSQNLELFKSLIQDLFYKDVTDQELYEAALKGMFQALDPYSVYYNTEEAEEFNTDVSGNYKGIGIKFDGYNNYLRIVQVFAGSPAYEKGIMPGDYIIGINNEEVTGWSTTKAASLIKGDIGTSVRLTILRGEQVLDFDVERASIQAESCSFSVLNDDIAYIKIEEFNLGTAKEVEKYLNTIKITGYDKLILDLRNNTGGYVDQAVAVARNFIPQGIVTTLKYKNPMKNITYMSYLKENPYKKMVVLVNNYSASSTEILAGALKDNGIKLIGEPTFGKGVFQNVFKLRDGGSIKITTGQYFTPSGICIDGIGITPDIVVSGDDAQLQRAIEEVNNY